MKAPFLDRKPELERLRSALDLPGGSLVCLYGRRRLGKTRLLAEVLRGRPAAYYVGDDRDASLQREALAREIAALLPGFDSVGYPGWEPLLSRWWSDAPPGGILALDEFPSLVAVAPELPSLLQKFVDRGAPAARHLVLCGSSQRMMLGLLLDASAPLYGRAREIVRLEPMAASWLGKALRLDDPADVVRHHAVWGGVPRYWELAAEHPDLWLAIERLALDPLGVLHREPERLLLDDMTETARAASILALIGQGCHRLSEIAGRLGVPATSLARPIARLAELGFVERESPFGSAPRSSKRTLYQIADPYLRFWFRFVEPNRSRLGAGQIVPVRREIEEAWAAYLGSAWEDLARRSVGRMEIEARRWKPASRWWGRARGGESIELDLVAEADGDAGLVLVGEAKLRATDREIPALLAELERKAAACPDLEGCRVLPAVWVLEGARSRRRPPVLTAKEVLRAG